MRGSVTELRFYRAQMKGSVTELRLYGAQMKRYVTELCRRSQCFFSSYRQVL